MNGDFGVESQKFSWWDDLDSSLSTLNKYFLFYDSISFAK